MPDYSPIPLNEAALKRARRWALLGVAALGIAGIFAGALDRKSPYFDTALIEHVDLSVLIWFLTIACMFFTLVAQGRERPHLAGAAFYSFMGGTLLIIAAGFGGGAPIKSNYIPVIHHPLFFCGLGMVLLGVMLAIMQITRIQIRSPAEFGIHSVAWIILLALACCIWTVKHLPPMPKDVTFYEYAFWGGGHVLQFAHAQLLMVAWLWLARAGGLSVKLSSGWTLILYAVSPLAALSGAFIYLSGDIMAVAHSDRFTLLMRHANGIAPLIVGGFIVAALFAKRENPVTAEHRLPLMMLGGSLLLFAVGGILGYRIAGSNLIVPAHYHGSIVGITLAYMGVVYLLLPSFGFADVRRSRLALFQPVLYGGGQFCWMVSMAILGEAGAPRKTAGSAEYYTGFVAFLKHSADGLALIGGLLFVFIVGRAICCNSRKRVEAV